MIKSNEILEKLLQAEPHSPQFNILNKTLEAAIENEARIAEINAITDAEIRKQTEIFAVLSEATSSRLALASIYGTPKSVENILKEDIPTSQEEQAQQEFSNIIKSCNTDKPEPQYVPSDYTELGNLMVQIMKIDESLLVNEIKQLQDYKILEKKYLDLEAKTIFKGKWPLLVNVIGRGAQAAPNLGKCKAWLVNRILDKYPELKCVETEVDEKWKMLPALSEKCRELRQLAK